MLRYVLPCWAFGVLVSFLLPVVPPLWAWIAVFGLILLAAWRWKPAAVLLCVLLGMAYGVWRTESALARQWPVARVENVALTMVVDDLPRRDERRVQFAAKAWDKDGGEYRLMLSDYQLRDWPVGSRWQVSARVRPVVGEVNLRGLNREAWALANGVGGMGSLGKGRVLLAESGGLNLTLWRERISRNWQQANLYGHEFSDGIGLMRALGIGEQSALRAELWQAFRPLGLTHLVSISGLHVTMVAVWFGFLVKLLLRALPVVPKRPRLWVLTGGVLGALLYAGLAGFGVPTQRSVLMLAAFAYAWWRGSGSSPWAGWWQALALVLLFDPLAALGVGLWLSFGLVAALIWSSAGRLNERGWWLAVRGQWAVTLLSVVLLGYMFASLPLLSPLVNVVAIPWFSWVLTPLALLGSALPFAPLQWLAAVLAEYTLRFLVWLAGYSPEFAVAAAPWPLMALAVLAALVLLLPRGTALKPWACLVLVGFVFYRMQPLPEDRLKVWVWDAGQGLSVLMQTREHRLLFDTGTAYATGAGIVPSLNGLGIRRLDKLVLSHHDIDHDGGYTAVKRSQPPQKLLAGQPEFYPQAEFCDESQWVWNGVVFEFLRPSEAYSGKDDNDESCVLRVVTDGQALLITGDMGQKGELDLVQKYGDALYSQVLVLGHHGSNTASAGTFLNAVSPQYAVASSGYANSYGHPTKVVQNKVAAHGATLLRTDLSGALVFELGGGAEVFQGRLKQQKFYWQKKPFD
ncbi:DNA internalization-related competence protein ComEC/Rec2 [Neisseria sp. CCUG17229]|uniref:DNA internalization-related competence protein ComEC/Rec2 n=1 Tax=Neisseria sp. CCUG17229 TaxID=3392036 RepID=UPI003A0FE8A9